MNVQIISKTSITDDIQDKLAKELPVIISGVLEVPGGNVAIVKPAQVALEFRQASRRDTGADIRIMIFARNNEQRLSTEDDRAQRILEKITAVTASSGKEYTVDVRLYLLEIGAANHT